MPTSWWLIAVGAVLVGNTFISLGLLLQKRSHHKRRGEQVEAYFLSPEWLVGLVTFFAGHACCWAGLAVGAQMVMSCLNCWCIVVTILIAPLLFHETVSLYRLLAVLVLVIGCVWVTLAGPKKYETFTVERFELNLADEAFLVVTACTVVAALAIAVVPRRTGATKRSVTRLTMGAAICAWYSVLAAKCFSGLHFTSWHGGRNQLGYWQTWAAGVFFVCAAVANLHLLNLALAAGDAVTVMPAYESLSLAGQIVVGGMFFQEFRQLDARGHFWFWSGVAVVLSGVIMVSRPEPKHPFLQHVILGSVAAADDVSDFEDEEEEEGGKAAKPAMTSDRAEPRLRPAAAAADGAALA